MKRIGIITSPERREFYQAALGRDNQLDLIADPNSSIMSALIGWQRAHATAAIIDDAALELSPALMTEALAWRYMPHTPPLRILFIAREDQPPSYPSRDELQELSFGGVIPPYPDATLARTLVDLIDSIPAESLSPGSEEGSARRNRNSGSHVAAPEDREQGKGRTLFGRKKPARTFEKEAREEAERPARPAKEEWGERLLASFPSRFDGADEKHGAGRGAQSVTFAPSNREEDPPVYRVPSKDAPGPARSDAGRQAPDFKPAHETFTFVDPAEAKADGAYSETTGQTNCKQNTATTPTRHEEGTMFTPNQDNPRPFGEPQPHEQDIHLVVDKLNALLDRFEALEQTGAVSDAHDAQPAGRQAKNDAWKAEEADQDAREEPRIDHAAHAPYSLEEIAEDEEFDGEAPAEREKDEAKSDRAKLDKQPRGKCVIAFAELQHGCGSTHLGVSSALWLADEGYRACFVFSDKQRFLSMREALNVTDLPSGAFRFKNCDFFWWSQQAPFASDYDYVVVDCGVLTFAPTSKTAIFEVFYYSAMPIVCASGDPWDIYQVAEVLKKAKTEEIVRWRWFFTGATPSFMQEIQPVFDYFKKRITQGSEFKHLYSIERYTNALDPEDGSEVFQQALFDILPRKVRAKMRRLEKEAAVDDEL